MRTRNQLDVDELAAKAVRIHVLVVSFGTGTENDPVETKIRDDGLHIVE